MLTVEIPKKCIKLLCYNCSIVMKQFCKKLMLIKKQEGRNKLQEKCNSADHSAQKLKNKKQMRKSSTKVQSFRSLAASTMPGSLQSLSTSKKSHAGSKTSLLQGESTNIVLSNHAFNVSSQKDLEPIGEESGTSFPL